MRTRREVAVRDQTWVTSNPREMQGSRGTQSRLDRGATQRKSPSPASSNQWPALISPLTVCRPSLGLSALVCQSVLSGCLAISLSFCVSLSFLFPSLALVGGCGPPPLVPPSPMVAQSYSQYCCGVQSCQSRSLPYCVCACVCVCVSPSYPATRTRLWVGSVQSVPAQVPIRPRPGPIQVVQSNPSPASPVQVPSCQFNSEKKPQSL